MTNPSQVIIGTAGHIDHGKTSIVKALTGTDTDRLKEEKKRGMTIDIGFAYLNNDITIIDVPGHEKFIRNMVAGVSTINIALIVVSADDGLMPQTHEHIEILDLLDIKHAIVVLSKEDKVEKNVLRIAEGKIKDRIKRTNFHNAKIIRTSIKNGTGIDTLKKEILLLSRHVSNIQDRNIFYMPIDRIFSKVGFGTIVTGTVLSGQIEKNSEIDIFPCKSIATIRSMQTHGREIDLIKIGDRAAINIANIDHGLLNRGSVLVEKNCMSPTSKIIANIKMIDMSNWKIKDKQFVHIHIGTSSVIARVTTYGKNILPGKSANVIFDLNQQITPMYDQRFIIRSISPMETIAGGKILDNNPNYRNKELKKNIQKIEVDRSKRFFQLVMRDWKKPCSAIKWSEKFNVSRHQIHNWVKAYNVSNLDSLIFTPDNLEKSKKDIHDKIKDFHRNNKYKKSIPKEELLHQAEYSKKWFEYVIDSMKGVLAMHGAGYALIENEVNLSDDDLLIVKDIESALIKSGFNLIPSIKIHKNQKKALNLLYILKERGSVIQVDSDLWMHFNNYNILKNELILYFNRYDKLSVPEFKEMISVTRKNAIPLLEFCDKIKFTLRVDNYRVTGEHLNE